MGEKMEFRVTVLCENTVPRPGLLGEHGFAAFVEAPEGNILFDTGQGFALIHNALRLQKDLRTVERVVLSHGHFDHTGGLLAFLEAHGPCEVVAHPAVLSERFWALPGKEGQEPLSIGLPWRESVLVTRGARFRWLTGFTEIQRNVFVTGEVPRSSAFEGGDPRMLAATDGGRGSDPFSDDNSLVLKSSKGLVVVLGCAHAGIVNIVEHAVAGTGEDRVHAILGGTHLGFCSELQLDETIEALKRRGVDLLAVSHCTGQAPAARLAAEFGKGFAFAPVGYALEV